MKFALQALFQTFFLEVSRGSFLCERAALFEVDYTQRTACYQKMVLMCEFARGTQQRIRASAAAVELPCARKAARHPSAPVRRQNNAEAGSAVMCAALAAV